jgi:hypothetical protein
MLENTENIVTMLKTILDPLPEHEKEMIARWAQREAVSSALITVATQRTWVNAYEKDGKLHPAGYHTLTWEAGAPSPHNANATIFAMLQADDEHVHIYSAAMTKVAGSEDVSVQYFREVLFHPDTVFGPMTGEALFEEFCNYFATEEEQEKIDKVREARGRAATSGAPS